MYLDQRKKYLIFIFLWFCCVLAYAENQANKKISVEWTLSAEAEEATSLPRYQWIENGKAIIYDVRKPKNQRTFEVLDPETGIRTPFLNMSKALKDLRSYLGKDETPDILPWPDSMDRSGQRAAYLFGGDIYLLKIDTADFARITNTEDEETGIRFSPDGTKIAFVRSYDIFVYDIKQKKEIPITAGGSELLFNGPFSFMYGEDVFPDEEVGIWWSPDSRSLAYARTDVSKVTELYYYDIKPFHPRLIKQRYPLVGETIETVRIGVTELGTKKTTWIDSTGRPDEYVVHVDWLCDSHKLSVQILNRDQNVLELYFADAFSGKSQLILKETDNAWVNLNDDVYFLRDGKHFVWGSERSGYKHLYLYSSEGKLEGQITKGEWAIRGPFQHTYWWGRSVVAIDEHDKLVYFTGLAKSSLERHLYKITFDGADMKRITKEDGFHSVTFSPNAKYYFDQHSTISSLPSLSVHRNDGRLMQVLAGPRSDILAKFDLDYPEFLTIQARDGFPLPAQLLRPKDFDPKKRYPVIIYHYGGPSAPTVLNVWQRFTFFNQILLDKGYLCFAVDNRSATAKSKKLENTIFQQMLGMNELNDLLAAVKWLKSQTYVDPERVGIWGGSYGGSFALLAMTRSEEFRAGIAISPASDQRFHEPKWAEFAMKRPQDNIDAWESVSLLRYAKNLHGRLMIVHGTYDDNVRIQNTWAFVDELLKAGKNFDMMIYPMRKHGISDLQARTNLFFKMIEFWTRNL
jgi:dipeptidyl-peptidase-4